MKGFPRQFKTHRWSEGVTSKNHSKSSLTSGVGELAGHSASRWGDTTQTIDRNSIKKRRVAREACGSSRGIESTTAAAVGSVLRRLRRRQRTDGRWQGGKARRPSSSNAVNSINYIAAQQNTAGVTRKFCRSRKTSTKIGHAARSRRDGLVSGKTSGIKVKITKRTTTAMSHENRTTRLNRAMEGDLFEGTVDIAPAMLLEKRTRQRKATAASRKFTDSAVIQAQN